MGLLRRAENEMAFAKVGIMGFAGAGKTYTASLIAIGLHGHIGSKKPVAMLDTETGSDFTVSLFRKAGVELLVAKTKSFPDLMAFMAEAREASDIAIIDSVSHIWAELQSGFLSKINANRSNKITRLEFQHWGPIKAEWARFTGEFLSAPMHTIICGRAGYEYEYQQDDEDTKKELVKVGTKMKAEGEFAYEPSLLIEMDKIQTNPGLGAAKKKKTVTGVRTVVNRAFVIKDRADILDGQFIENPTFDSFLPHFITLNIGGTHRTGDPSGTSSTLFDAEGANEWTREKKFREKWLEEITGLLASKFPGQSSEEKKKKNDLFHQFLGTRSMTAAGDMKSEVLRAAFEALKAEIEKPAPSPVAGGEAA
jgi:hypothetical protein